MARLLTTLVLIGLVWWGLRRLLAGRSQTGARRHDGVPRFEKTVRCKRCGAHMPLSLARTDAPGYVCNRTDADCRRRTSR